MHFGKTLEARKSPRFGSGYLEYAYLKRQLKVVLGEPSQLRQWISLLEAEITRVDRYAASRVDDAKVSVSQLSRHVGALTRDRATPDELARAEAAAAELCAMLVDLSDFLWLNKTAVSKIVKKHDKLLQQSTRAYILARLDASGFLAHSLEGFLLAISDIYTRLRALGDGSADAEEGGVWTAPESFERDTTKLWVLNADVFKLQLMIVRHLPLLVYGRDTSKFKAITPLERDR